jgi:dTMP kinase
MSWPESGGYAVIEGVDGSGKTTQTDIYKDILADDSVKVEKISEPGGTPIGEEIRAILKNGDIPRTINTDLDLFMIARRELISQKIAPLVSSGVTIISDRNWYSSVAYQGFGEGFGAEAVKIRAEQTIGAEYLHPPTVILDIPLDALEDRIRGRNAIGNDYFEQKGKEYFKKVLYGYQWVAENYPKVELIDGSKSIEDVHKHVAVKLTRLLMFQKF